MFHISGGSKNVSTTTSLSRMSCRRLWGIYVEFRRGGTGDRRTCYYEWHLSTTEVKVVLVIAVRPATLIFFFFFKRFRAWSVFFEVKIAC